LITTLAAVVRSVRAFDVCFGRTRWFGQDVLWLDPEPASAVPRADCGGVASFSAASAVRRCPCRRHSAPDHCRAAVGRFAYPPCGRAAVQSGLPLATRIEKVLLIAAPKPRTPGGWLTSYALTSHPRCPDGAAGMTPTLHSSSGNQRGWHSVNLQRVTLSRSAAGTGPRSSNGLDQKSLPCPVVSGSSLDLAPRGRPLPSGEASLTRGHPNW
jgi:hypothetical protein